MTLQKYSDELVCVDCFGYVACGEVQNPDPRWSLGGCEHALRMHALGERRVHTGDPERAHEFSRRRCDLCGSTLGGRREHVEIWQTVP